MIPLSRLPANDDHHAAPVSHGAPSMHRHLAASDEAQDAARVALLAQPEVARKGPRHEIRRAIVAARTVLQWAWVAEWFQSASEGRRIANALLASAEEAERAAILAGR